MKLSFPGINKVIPIHEEQVNSLIIENPNLLYSLVWDIKEQLNKKDGTAVFSKNNELMDIYKSIDMITDVYNIDLNSKSIMSKMIDELSKKAVDTDNFEKTMQLITNLENYISDLIWDMDCELKCEEIFPKQILKSLNISVVDDNMDLSERIIKYVEIVRKFLGEKLFIFINVRGFIQPTTFELLTETLLQHQFKIFFIDNKEYPKVSNENRWIIDVDLCEF